MYTNRARWVFWTAAAVLIGVPWTIGMARFARAGRVQPVAAAVERAPLPIESPAAPATAAAFVADYLTFDPADTLALGARSERLRNLMASGDGYAGLVASKETKPQSVVATWTHGYRDASADGTRGTFIVQALVEASGGRRHVYLAVPVATDGRGRWAVTDLPHFVAAPGRAQIGPDDSAETLNDSDGAVRAMLEGFLKAYVHGTPAEIAVYMAPEATAPAGLAGSMRLQFREVNELKLLQDPAGARAEVSATMADQVTGATYRHSYRVHLVQVNGRWAVRHLE